MKPTISDSLSSTVKTASSCCRALFLRRPPCKAVWLLVVCCALSLTVSAQNAQFTQGNVDSGLDNNISIPIWSYPGRGAASLPVNLYYSSKVWRIGYINTIYAPYPAPKSVTEAIYAEHSTAGWTTSLDVPKVEWPQPGDIYWQDGKPYHYGTHIGYTYRVARLFIHMPDGSTHELRRGNDQVYADNGYIDKSGTFYAVDGSRLRYDVTGTESGILYLPDGSRYFLGGSTVQYIDRNGNTLNYNTMTRQWKDTLGRDIGLPFPADPAPQDYVYTVRGVGNTSVNYIFKWRTLSAALALGSPTLKSLADYYLPNPSATPTQQGGANFPQATQGASLFASGLADEENGNSYTYVVGRGQSGSQLFNPVVLAEIELPNGQSYKFSYNIYGEIEKVTYPTGGYQRYQYAEVPTLSQSSFPYTQASRGVTLRAVSANGNGTDEAQWLSESSGSMVKTTAPDGTYTKTYRHNYILSPEGKNFGYEDERNALAYDEQVYAPNDLMLRRTLTEWEQSSVTYPTPATPTRTYTAKRNPRPIKTVSLILDTGGDALVKTVTYAYDTTYQLSTGIDLITSSETQFAFANQTTAQTGAISSMPAGALASSAETTYLNDAAYRERNILGLRTAVVLKDANGQVVSKTEKFYDEAAYPLLTYGDLLAPDYIDPQTSVRGNMTTARRYTDIAGNLYLETHAQFDQCGNVRNAWNERGIQSQMEYSSTYKHAYTTSTTTAAPDPSGANGSATGFTSSSVFDYTTGLVLSSIDANGQTTTFSYTDPTTNQPDVLNRVRKVIRPDGGWTSTDFNDVVGDLHTVTKTKQDATHTTESRQYFDKLGRSVRACAWESGTDYLASDTEYDLLGRVWRVSNPYRTQLGGAINPPNLWTTSNYDALGRVTQVSLPDGTSVQTSYQGIYTTVTDQAGKQRRQMVDALGRMVRVDEPDATGSLGSVDAPVQATSYEYDTLGNLIHIAQGAGTNTQHRYFKYDALSRLTYERQVEQVAPAAFNLYDPLTANSHWTRKLSYDETLNGISYRGLLTTQVDARLVTTQFAYDQLNRPTQVTYSDGTPTVSNYYDQAHTGYFNKGQLTRVQTSAVAASGQVPALPATAQVYDYNLMGRVVAQQQMVDSNTYTLAYSYDMAGQLTSESYPSGRVVNYNYGAAARLTSITSGGTVYASQLQYNAQGLLSSVQWGNGATESYQYNARLQLSEQSLVKDSATIQRYEYKYGQVNPTTGVVDETKNNGQLGRIESFIGTARQWQQRLTYDSVGRLSTAGEYRGDTLQQTYLLNYDYDLFGNRYQKQARNQGNPSGVTQTWVEDADISQTSNRLTMSGMQYDAAGNVIRDEQFRHLQLLYDANNRHRQSANLDGTNAATAIYDGAGQRVATKTNNTLSISVYDVFGKLVAEYAQVPASTGGTQYILQDQQGTPRAVLNSSGSVLSRHDYQPFGEELAGSVGLRSTTPGYSTGDGIKQKYAGMEADATGLSHTLWRQYESKSGRWTAPDPYGGSLSTGDPQSFNRYSYVQNDPVNHVDPLGLMRADSSAWRSIEGASEFLMRSIVDELLGTAVNTDYVLQASTGQRRRPPRLRPHKRRPGAGKNNRNPDGLVGNSEGEQVRPPRTRVVDLQQQILFLEDPNAFRRSFGPSDALKLRIRIEGLVFSERCNNAFSAAGLLRPDEFIMYYPGIVVGPASLLKDSSQKNLDYMGITEEARQKYLNYVDAPNVHGFTIRSIPLHAPQTADARPRIFFNASALSTLDETPAHEFIHAMGKSPTWSLLGTHDLSGFSFYNRIIESCR